MPGYKSNVARMDATICYGTGKRSALNLHERKEFVGYKTAGELESSLDPAFRFRHVCCFRQCRFRILEVEPGESSYDHTEKDSRLCRDALKSAAEPVLFAFLRNVVSRSVRIAEQSGHLPRARCTRRVRQRKLFFVRAAAVPHRGRLHLPFYRASAEAGQIAPLRTSVQKTACVWKNKALPCRFQLADLGHQLMNRNALRTVLLTGKAGNAVCAPGRFPESPRKPSGRLLFFQAFRFVLRGVWQQAFDRAGVIDGKDPGNIDTCGTVHTIPAAGTGNRAFCKIGRDGVLQHFPFRLAERLDAPDGREVIFNLRRIAHAAEHGKHTGQRSGKPDGPGGDGMLRVGSVQNVDGLITERDEGAAFDRFHHDYLGDIVRDSTGVKLSGALAVPIQIVELDLREIPLCVRARIRYSKVSKLPWKENPRLRIRPAAFSSSR